MFIQDEKYVGKYDRCTDNCERSNKKVEFGQLVKDLYTSLRNTVIVKSTKDDSNIVEASLRQGINMAKK